MPAEGGRTGTAGSGTKSLSMADTLNSKSVLDKQRAAIEKLRTQNEQLKHELLLENKFSVRPGDPYAQSLINSLQDEGDNLARKIVLEMRKTKMLDLHLSAASGTLATSRSLMGGINTAKEQSIGVQKRIKILENRLEKAYVKYNQSITHTKQLREQINNLRRERLMFESIHGSLERELTKIKRDMADTIQLANQVFEAKEKAIAEMGVLMAQADKEQAGFEEEWRQLTQIIEDDKRERERARAAELAARERETQELLKNGLAGTRRGSSRSGPAGGPAYNKALAQNVAAEKVQVYGAAFERIQGATGIEDIDQLVSSFISAEDHNYTLFNYVNEVNTEIEKLEDQITVIRREMEAYAEGGQSLERTRLATQRLAADRQAAAESLAELYERRYEAATGTVGKLKDAIWQLFNDIGCNTAPVRELLGNEGGVTEGNVLAHLGIIEQRTNELLQAYVLARVADGGATGPSGGLPAAPVIAEALVAQPLTSVSPRIVIEPPSSLGPTAEEMELMASELAAATAAAGGTGGAQSSDPSALLVAGALGGEDERPLTREALETRVAKMLPRKLETAIKVRPPGADSPTKRASPGNRR